MRIAISALYAVVCLFSFTTFVGCGSPDSGYKEFSPGEAKDISEDEHDHEHEGPHGGEIIELGEEEYHAEVVFDEEKNIVSIYILDSSAEKTVAVEQKELTIELTGDEEGEEFTLSAVPLEDDPEGKTSRFQIEGEELIEEFHHHEDLEGVFHITIAGKEFKGTVTHEEDEHQHEHGHKHEHDKGHKKSDTDEKESNDKNE